MSRLPAFFRWLALAALADWLIARTITRSAIFMPKSPPVITAYQLLSFVGQVSATFAGLLAIAALAWIVWTHWRSRGGMGFPIVVVSLIALSIAFLFAPAEGWLRVAYQLLVIAALGMITAQKLTAFEKSRFSGRLFPALALLAGSLYQLSHALYAALHWPGPPPFASALFNLGELFVVLGAIAIWWAYGRGLNPWHDASLLWAAVPALAFAAGHLANQSMTGIIAIWSTGMTLYLPWPLYAASLWLAGATVVTSLRRGDSVAWAILLLAAGGYAPQLSTQVFVGLVGLWLLTPIVEGNLQSLVSRNTGRMTWTTSNESSA
ncbi:MAG: hypothetical protein HY023_04110 [Chloroflexi bacterium]|nr:hypothetical protein [Chloroflexota bacterium]